MKIEVCSHCGAFISDNLIKESKKILLAHNLDLMDFTLCPEHAIQFASFTQPNAEFADKLNACEIPSVEFKGLVNTKKSKTKKVNLQLTLGKTKSKPPDVKSINQKLLKKSITAKSILDAYNPITTDNRSLVDISLIKDLPQSLTDISTGEFFLHISDVFKPTNQTEFDSFLNGYQAQLLTEFVKETNPISIRRFPLSNEQIIAFRLLMTKYKIGTWPSITNICASKETFIQYPATPELPSYITRNPTSPVMYLTLNFKRNGATLSTHNSRSLSKVSFKEALTDLTNIKTKFFIKHKHILSNSLDNI